MSEPIPESIPTSSDRRSQRPAKKARGPATPYTLQSAQVEALFAHPERDISIPSGPKPKTVAPPPEIVTNVQGSSAGAGSGEFHVYKASRRREYERLRLMDEEVRKEEADREFEARREERRKEDEEKLEKNRARREKAKMRAAKKKAGVKMEAERNVEEGVESIQNDSMKKRLGPRVPLVADDGDVTKQDDSSVEYGDDHAIGNEGLTIYDD